MTHDLAAQIVAAYTHEGRKIVTAESCTGGLIAAALTDIPGSSAVVERGFVTYSNDAKIEVLGVTAELIEDYGAVSAQVAEEMAQGALDFSRAQVAISATGIAGPGGGSKDKPVGLVYFGLVTREGTRMHYKCQFAGGRDEVRAQAVAEGLRLLASLVEK
jgi:nicotinamide-nucleotide amidase